MTCGDGSGKVFRHWTAAFMLGLNVRTALGSLSRGYSRGFMLTKKKRWGAPVCVVSLHHSIQHERERWEPPMGSNGTDRASAVI